MPKSPGTVRHEYKVIIEQQQGAGAPLRVSLARTDGLRGVVAESNPATALTLRTAFRQLAEQITSYRDLHEELP
jgi:hypothetical protein